MGCTRAYLYTTRDAPADRGNLRTGEKRGDHRSSKVPGKEVGHSGQREGL